MQERQKLVISMRIYLKSSPFTILNFILFIKSLVHYVSISSGSSRKVAPLPSMNIIPKCPLVNDSTYSLVYVGWYCWVINPLSYADLILSTLKCGTHCYGRSSCNETTDHQKISVLYRLCIERHN
jgi:hypothetical protein